MEVKHRVLLTNDDGYEAVGIQTLSQVLADWCEVYVVAPLKQQSGASHSMTGFKKIMVQEVRVPGAVKAWAVDGTPVDSVKIGLEKLLSGKIDFVISGINKGGNLGIDVFYSGTVGAATEAAILGVPALAVSLNTAPLSKTASDYRPAAELTGEVLRRLGQQAKEANDILLLNLNIPDIPREEIKGVKAARLGVHRYNNALHEQELEDGQLAFVLGGVREELSSFPDDDTRLIRQGYATLTPLTLERTALEKMALCKVITGEDVL